MWLFLVKLGYFFFDVFLWMVEINNYSFIIIVCYLDSNESVINVIFIVEGFLFVYGFCFYFNGCNIVFYLYKR